MIHTLNQSANVAMDPPFHEAYKSLLAETAVERGGDAVAVKEWELPVVDLRRLRDGAEVGEVEQCKNDIIRASQEWGFFQVVNHGVSSQLLGKMRAKQIGLFKQPFERKSKEDMFLNFSAGSYRWGTPTATSLTQLSWSEAFHVSLSDILGSNGSDDLRSTMEEFAGKVSRLAQELAEILGENLGRSSKFFVDNCVPSTCYLRMNRYPPCSVPGRVFGLMPHTDSDFLTILHQDQVGGLELVKDGEWIAVKPNPEALIINIGDLFQAWSNNVYKSVEHRVVTNSKLERFSIAYFFCPWSETVIKSKCEPGVYRRFSFREFRNQVQEDVRKHGFKIGLPKFVL
ncbi:gibberellin 2-beta-dioxygenase 8 [Cucurbita moschata]|uniref:gibberellin 2beta-dioxygenase n=1 Tax=Cucurbita moschata TaxID=3662 RepID=A0A6J1F422_CUCMO|nr:gibberellin 2-beta-dioxygenase 8 [Cucurbita moschata]